MIKIRVGLPSYDGKLTIPTEETISRLRACKDYDFEIVRINGALVHSARNMTSLPIVKKEGGSIRRVKMPYDYYLAMDGDVAFDVDNIRRLISADKDIIGGAYNTRGGKTDLVVAGYYDKCDGDIPPSKWIKLYDTGIKEVDWCGAGCLLIRKQVFENMDYPYWTHNVIEYKEYREVVGEDVSFCMNAKAAGFKTWIDLDNRIAHISTRE